MRILSLLLLLIALPALAQQASTFDPALATRLQSTLDSGRANRNTIGISVAIISPRQGTWLGTSGNSEPGMPIRPEMLLGIGSITKTFTAAAIMQMVSEGKISLDDHVVKFLPPIPNVDTNVTIRQMLQHTSGIFNYTNSQDFWIYTNQDLDRHITPSEILQFIETRRFAPGASWSYSNTNYLLLGMIIELISGNDYESEIRERFLDPLELRSVAMGTDDELPGNVAHNWADFTGDGINDDITYYPRRAIYSGAWAAGGYFSTAEDLARWARALYGGSLLSPETIARMTTFRNLSDGSGYGLGTMRQRVAGKTMWGHNGAIVAYYSTMLYNPQDSVAFVALINQDGLDAEEILEEVVAEYYRTPSSVREGEIALLRTEESHPNPFTTTTSIGYRLEQPADVGIRIYNESGELVRAITPSRQEAGSRSILWDGLDGNGAPVSPGPYICIIESAMGRVASKLVKLVR